MSDVIYQCPKCKFQQARCGIMNAGQHLHLCENCGQLNIVQIAGNFTPVVVGVIKSKKQLYRTEFVDLEKDKQTPNDLRLLLNANLLKVRSLNEALQIAKVALKKRNGTKRVLQKIHKMEQGD